jgi:predicted TIM-barrel fold metal-dependent hydrolase
MAIKKIIDMHLHLYSSPEVAKEGDWNSIILDKNLKSLTNSLKELSIKKGLVIILDTNFLTNKTAVAYLRNNRNKLSNLSFCLMLDFRKAYFSHLLDLAKDLKVKAIKIHPYLQKIAPKDYEKVGKLAKKASALGFILVVDCSYGTKYLYDYNGIRLCAYLSNLISTPIIMAHSGGAQALEAFSLAADTTNLYLETSFSLDFWKGSSAEQDFAFAFKKLGSTRCLYGSDAPFVNIEDSIKTANEFFKKYKFSKKEINNILYNSAKTLLKS